MRKQLTLAATAAALLTFASFSVQAMPASPLQGLSNTGPAITQVRGGCGRGMHRNWRGNCVANRWWRR